MNTRRYQVELAAFMVAYAVLLVVSITLLKHALPTGITRTLLAVMPMLPALGVCWASVRELRRIDEFRRRVQLEALASAFLATAFVTFSYGFLENAGYPRLSMFVVWPLMATFWIIARAVCVRRYA